MRPLTTAGVAKRLGVSPSRVNQLDDVLHPTRLESGQRLFDPEIVERVAAERAARQAERDARRADDTTSTQTASAV